MVQQNGKMSEKACAAGQKEKLSKNKFEKKGYTFAGWKYAARWEGNLL